MAGLSTPGPVGRAGPLSRSPTSSSAAGPPAPAAVPTAHPPAAEGAPAPRRPAAPPLSTTRTYREILRANVFTFINDTLFALGLALVVLGRWSDALVSVGVVVVNAAVGVVQEVRAKRVLDRIALLNRPTATVLRSGREQVVDPAEVEPGEVLLAGPGDQIVVDGVLLAGAQIDVDESLLTGESDRVPKQAGDPVWSGSFCVGGRAAYQARAVGAGSLAGQITAQARAFRRPYTPLQREIQFVVRMILMVAASFEVVLIAATLLEGAPLVESVKAAVVIVGLVPNGLFVAMAVAYALGALRLARKGALLQQANAVESLSHVDVLCLDKTGTITTGRFVADAIQAIGADPAEAQAWLGAFAASVSASNRTTDAIAHACAARRRPVREEVSFSSARKWSGLSFAAGPPEGALVLGAPEVLLPHVGPEADGAAVERAAAAWAAAGRRVVLFARGPSGVGLHDATGQPSLPAGLAPVALVGLREELRTGARATFQELGAAGVRFVLVSGDNPDTVRAQALQAGIAVDRRGVAGPELAALDPVALGQLAERANLFGRLTPEQKEQIVQALRKQGHYVAMLGDGVNDVPALKRADLGIAVRSGSQIARAVADLILLDDSFDVLPRAVREGQRIQRGMQPILRLFLTRVLCLALLILAVGMVDAGFPLAPKHNALLTLLTVGLPTIILAAWARPAPVPRQMLIGSLLRFVVPAAWSLALVGMVVYLIAFQLSRVPAPVPGALDAPATLAAAQHHAQSALTTLLVFCGLLLVPLAETPLRQPGDGRPRIDWRGAGLAAALLALFAWILVNPGPRAFFDLEPMAPLANAGLALVALGWVWGLSWSWRVGLLDRALGLDASG